MFKWNKLNSQRHFISETSKELAPNLGDEAEWVSPLLGRFVLDNISIFGDTQPFIGPFYELTFASRIDLQTDQFKEKHYFYDGAADIFGVFEFDIYPKVKRGYREEEDTKSSFRFQLDKRLFAPNFDDYDKLELYLKNGLMDKV